ncbi:helix-turn-helix transcriptional regulator [Ottowia sp.]|uniref:helix-turn-helix transcriptional regulator n=1 Tax=Ottowia sp. TaxID=1898956 RepID=UPI002B881CA8|nr:helix-turn-helix transcriptional regulator [Ottowia sp.]HRN77536.1 helix-turn-helix transcriptional regulator [Ottowia sp.]
MHATTSPSHHMLEYLSSAEVEPALRFDAWRERAHQWVEMLPLAPGVELDAELRVLHGTNCSFCTMRSSAYAMRSNPRQQAHAPDMVILSLMQAGELQRDDAPSGEPERLRPGALGLHDPTCMGTYRWSQNSREAFLALPRDEVLAALGRNPGRLPVGLEHSALAPALASQYSHLAMLMRQPHGLDDIEFTSLLQTTRSLALLLLRNVGRGPREAEVFDEEHDLDAARRVAALRFMEREAHRPELDVAAIARGAECSRTRLYAAFAAHDETVMGALREIRLQRAKGLIEQNARLHVGALAWRCGFADPSSFSKLFRARFGLLPTDWHQQAWAGAAGHAATN